MGDRRFLSTAIVGNRRETCQRCCLFTRDLPSSGISAISMVLS